MIVYYRFSLRGILRAYFLAYKVDFLYYFSCSRKYAELLLFLFDVYRSKKYFYPFPVYYYFPFFRFSVKLPEMWNFSLYIFFIFYSRHFYWPTFFLLSSMLFTANSKNFYIFSFFLKNIPLHLLFLLSLFHSSIVSCVLLLCVHVFLSLLLNALKI